jgi:Putative Se/S carrier protein-like
MSAQQAFAVVLFESVSHALRAEKIFKAAGISCKLIPVPRRLSSDCGICLRFDSAAKARVETVLKGKLDFYEIDEIKES